MVDHSSPPAGSDPAKPAVESETVHGYGDDRAELFASYQETMRQFLQSQENIMVAFLNGAAGHAQPTRGLPRVATRSAARPVPRIPAPAPAPVVGPAPATPAPVVSAPPATPAPKGNGKAVSMAVAQASTPASAPIAVVPTPPPAGALDAKRIADLLLGVVEDRTGYPRDMLALDQNMEAELGIDSIKRAEIVGVLLKTLPQTFNGQLADAAANLNGKKTLQDVIDLEREDVDKLQGMTPELAERLMAFLNELTEEGGEEPGAGANNAPAPA